MVECTSYDRLRIDGKMRDPNPALRAAGKSAAILSDDAYGAIPSTPQALRKYRKNVIPGEIIVHYGLKDQKLPDEKFTYGIATDTGESVEQIFNKAAEITQGIAEYKNDRKEDIYASKKREPLGKCFSRGYKMPEQVNADNFKGFGVGVEHPKDMVKNALYPRDEPETDDVHKRYVWTHGNYAPGEMINRNYNWPDETKNEMFRFGVTDRDEGGCDGDGAKGALNMEVEDDGSYGRTVIVQKNVDDFRRRAHDYVGKPHCMVYDNPPVPVNHAFGKSSGIRECTVELCIKSASEDFLKPDADLGKCIKVGRRNFTDDPRAFGTPSVRSDIPAPAPEKRSLADVQNYGDEDGAGPVLNPDKYQSMGIEQDVFLLRRKRDELRSILKQAGYDYDDEAYGHLWTKAVALFEDDLNLASVDSVLYITRQLIADDVERKKDALPIPE